MEPLKFGSDFYDIGRLKRSGGKAIGRGFYGFVYRFGKYAIKFYQSSHRDAVTCFEHEIAAYHLLNARKENDNVIPRCYDARVSHEDMIIDHPVMILDFVKGTSLHFIDPSDPMSFIERIKTELKTIIKNIHDAGVAHGDIRPENIIIRSSMQSGKLHQATVGHTEGMTLDASERVTDGGKTLELQPEQANSCVLFDFSHASTHADDDFERMKSHDWGMYKWTVTLTRQRLFSTVALSLLQKGLQTSESREEFLEYVEYADGKDYRLKRALLQLDADESYLYSIASCTANRSSTLTTDLFERVKAEALAHDKLKWTRLCAQNLNKRNRSSRAVEMLQSTLEDKSSLEGLSTEDRFGIWMDCIKFKEKDLDFTYALTASSYLLLDIWGMHWSRATLGDDISSKPSSEVTNSVASCIDYKRLIEELTSILRTWSSTERLSKMKSSVRPAAEIVQRSLKFYWALKELKNVGDCLPPISTLRDLVESMSTESAPGPIGLLRTFDCNFLIIQDEPQPAEEKEQRFALSERDINVETALMKRKFSDASTTTEKRVHKKVKAHDSTIR